MKIFPPKRISFLLTIVGLAFLLLWSVFFRGERMPFSDFRWQKGHAEILQGKEWERLHSVSGISMDLLSKEAIKNWGPGYQHHFGMQFLRMVQIGGGSTGWWMDFETMKDGEIQENWAWNTRQRRKAFVENQNGEQENGFTTIEPLWLFPKSLGEGNSEGEKWLEENEIRGDLNLLWKLVEAHYPDTEMWGARKEKYFQLGSSAAHGIRRRDFALQLQCLLGSFHDIHSRVVFSGSKIKIPQKNLPFDVREIEGQTLAMSPGGQALFHPEYPLVAGIADISIARLWATAHSLGGDAARWMQRIQLILGAHGHEIAKGDSLPVLLQTLDGKQKAFMLPFQRQAALSENAPRVEARILPGQIGHLRLRRGLYDDPGYAQEIKKAMFGLQNTSGLVLDLRGNRGGKRAILPLLMHYFLPDSAHPAILNIGVYRMAQKQRPDSNTPVLAARALFPANWPGWTSAQNQTISNWQATHPQLPYDFARFSAPSFMLSSGHSPEGVFYYSQPLVLLIDQETASATELILANLKGKPNVTVLGEYISTGGSSYPILFELPHSKIQFYLSSMRSWNSDLKPVDQTMPDIKTLPDLKSTVKRLREMKDEMLGKARLQLVQQAPDL